MQKKKKKSEEIFSYNNGLGWRYKTYRKSEVNPNIYLLTELGEQWLGLKLQMQNSKKAMLILSEQMEIGQNADYLTESF